MDRTTLLGFIAGVVAVAGSMAVSGPLPTFWNLPSVGIVLGGTLAALLVQYSLSQLSSVAGALKTAYLGRPQNVIEVIETVVNLSDQARRSQLLSIEADVAKLSDPFLRRGLQAVLDYTPREALQEQLEWEVTALSDRYKLGQSMFRSVAVLAPGFGMIGTLIGLVQMLHDLSDPTRLGPGMALALLTTFYGALIAYLIAQPVAGKLKLRGEEEVKLKLLMLEGILGVQDGVPGRVLRERLRSHISPYMSRMDTRAQAPGEAAATAEESR